MGVAYTTSRAEADLLDIWLHIAEDNVDAADNLIDKFHRRFTQLAQFPEMGQVREEFGQGVRGSSVEGYLVLYRPTDDGVQVLHLIHGARLR